MVYDLLKLLQTMTDDCGQLRYTRRRKIFMPIKHPLVGRALERLWWTLLTVILAGKFGLSFDGDAQGQARSGMCFSCKIWAFSNRRVQQDWTMFTASTFNSNTTTRDLFISMVHSRASYNQTSGAFPTLYNVDTGNSSTGQARWIGFYSLICYLLTSNW